MAGLDSHPGMRLFDTHAHLLDERFDEDREKLLSELPQLNIAYVLEACCSLDRAQDVLALADAYDYIFASLGTHPHEVAAMREAHLLGYEKLLAHEKALAVGEIGLDYHYDFSPREVQRSWFEAQLELAQGLGLPVILHVREAAEDAMRILRAHKAGLRGIMHCFSGSYETAKECVDLGLYIAFGGALTFENARKNIDAAAKLPLERLLIETDCPYMAPAPHRGKRNDPSLVRLVCEKLAAIRNMETEEIAAITLQNGKAVLGIA